MWSLFQHESGDAYLSVMMLRDIRGSASEMAYLNLSEYPFSQPKCFPLPTSESQGSVDQVAPQPCGSKQSYIIRKANPEDFEILLSFGYDAWGESQPLASFISSYQSSLNHLRGQRYLVQTLSGDILANLNTILFSKDLIGIASVATKPSARRMGLASLLLRAVISLLRLENPNYNFLLYSEISPDFYKRLGFTFIDPANQKFLHPAMGLNSRPFRPAELEVLNEYF